MRMDEYKIIADNKTESKDAFSPYYYSMTVPSTKTAIEHHLQFVWLW